MLHHRGLQQEVLGVGCLCREDLAEQVAGDLAPVAADDRRPLVGRPAADGDAPPGTVRSPSPRWPAAGRRDRRSPARRPAGRGALRSRCDRTRAPARRTPPGPPRRAGGPAAAAGSTRVATTIWPPVGRQSSSVSTILPAGGIDDRAGCRRARAGTVAPSPRPSPGRARRAPTAAAPPRRASRPERGREHATSPSAAAR